jgi:dipeptidyl aminopeptidase/acylaminoacyl peptidase
VQVARFGTWASPIEADLPATSRSFEQPDPSEEGVYWLESRPAEGRMVLVFKPWGEPPVDVVADRFNVRTSVHEYGGGAFFRSGATLYFTNFDDQRLYRQDGLDGEARPITPAPAEPRALRYADGVVTADGATIVCVRERHEGGDVVNELVALPADSSGEARVVVSGHDFFSFPRLSPDGNRLAWTSWDHPRMPFIGTDLWVADLAGGAIGEATHVAGGVAESIFQPEWGPDGTLHFVSDRSGWWNLYRATGDGVEALAPVEAELGWMQWLFAWSSYAFLPDGRIACILNHGSSQPLTFLDSAAGTYEDAGVEFDVARAPTLRAHGSRLAWIAGNAVTPPSIVTYDTEIGATEILRRAFDDVLDSAFVSRAEAIEFPTDDGGTGHAFFYPPANGEFSGPQDERPPLVVSVHGGPTAQSVADLSPGLQHLTSRGLAVVVVNYGGSTGYGRAYAERLKGQWGPVDTRDCIAAARYLIDRGDVDGGRIAITGGSAGGYTTLYALTFEDFFATGASFFGVTDLLDFNKTTHKFESQYDQWLLGRLPEAEPTYRERSPATHADDLDRPVLLLQGLDDKVVPPSQAEIMVDALRRNRVPFAYIAFEGEGHGFRKKENIRRSLEATFYFFSRVFGFEPADAIEPVEIENL